MKLSMRAVGFLITIMECITKYGNSRDDEIKALKTNPQLTQEERDALCTFITANDTLETVHVYLKAAGMYGHDELWLPTKMEGEGYLRNADGWYHMNPEHPKGHTVPAGRGEKVPNNVLFVVHGFLDNEKFGSGNFIQQFPTVWDAVRGSWDQKCISEKEAEMEKRILEKVRKNSSQVSLKLVRKIDYLGWPFGIYENILTTDSGFSWKEYWAGMEPAGTPELLGLVGFQTVDPLPDTFECTSEDCAYNNSGECRYCRVFDHKPKITEEDGCVDFVVKI